MLLERIVHVSTDRSEPATAKRVELSDVWADAVDW